ncbi:MAG: ElyC/SanA/YdcF family protein [Flavobacteriales bacterium]
MIFGLVITSYFGISFWTKNKIYDQPKKIPFNKVGLVLGTAKYLSKGGINTYFKHRMDAVALLFHHKKIQYLIVSGDNRRDNYNEPKVMEKELIKRGVPTHSIYRDYAGFRTLDSILRAYKIFGQKKFTVISQKFHNERAILIADHAGLDVIGFNAKDISREIKQSYLREAFARIKALWDIFYHTQPKFLGQKILIP